MKRIIFINQYVTHLFVDIINDFVQHEVEVTLVTGGIHSSHELSGAVRVIRFNAYRRQSFVSRLATWSRFGISTFFYLLRQNDPVFLTTNPPFLPFQGLWYSLIKRQPFHVLYYDIYPEALIKMGYLGHRNLISRYWRYITRRILEKAATVFTVGTILKKSLEEHEIRDKPIYVIPPWADNHFIRPMDKKVNPFAMKHRLTDCFVVLYSGNLGLTHDLDTMVDAAGLLRDHEDIKFVIIAEGARKRSLVDKVNQSGIMNITMLPLQDESQLRYTFSSADVGVVTLGAGAGELSVPSKTYSYLAAGCVILAIAGGGSELEFLLKEYKAGEIFGPGDAHGVSDFILRLKNNKFLFDDYKKNSRKASKDFGVENARLFYKIIQEGVGGSRR